jgi:hypothetical protein
MLLQGEMAEWSNAVVSKAIIPVKGIGGSNPPLSSNLRQGYGWRGQLFEGIDFKQRRGWRELA